MSKEKKLSVSYAPFWHNGKGILNQNYNIIIATLPALFIGLLNYGLPALGVVSLAISSSIIWESLFNFLSKKSYDSILNGNAILVGILLGILLPASAPWWLVISGSFIAIIIGIQIFGGIGGNPFNPVALAIAILSVSWKNYLDLDEVLVHFDLNFIIQTNPLATLKNFGTTSLQNISMFDLFIGNQVSSIGTGSSIAIILGGIYLITRGFIRWEITISFLIGIFITALIFNLINPSKYAGPLFHILTGYTTIGAFFLATEDSSSPVNFIPMLIYGTLAGTMTILIRNIGLYYDGVIFAILIANLANPIIDKIRPKAISKAV